jgi:hypothetical protein
VSKPVLTTFLLVVAVAIPLGVLLPEARGATPPACGSATTDGFYAPQTGLPTDGTEFVDTYSPSVGHHVCARPNSAGAASQFRSTLAAVESS